VNEERPWHRFYDPHVPRHIDCPRTTLPEALRETARRHPDHPALIFKGRRITYRAYDQAVDRLAAALQVLGVRKGDRVAVHLPNCPQFPIAYTAILRSGGIVVPCNPTYTPRELLHPLTDSAAKVIITLSSTYPIVRAIRHETALEHVIVARIKTYFPPLLRTLFTLLKEKKTGHGVDLGGDAHTSWYTDLLSKAPSEPRAVPLSWDDTAVLMYTGGTTGVSKGAELTHGNILMNALQVVIWVDAWEARESTLASLPLFHSYGMTCCLNPGAIVAGTCILIPDPRDIKDILRCIHKYRPTFYPGVPAMYVAINNHSDVRRYDLRSLRVCNSGAAPLPIEVQERFQGLTGARLIEGYGLSEASPVTHANPAYGQSRMGTIGIPYPDTDARIVDADSGETIMGVGEVGELCIRGPQVMKGYWNRPEETAQVIRPDPGGGGPWLYTGDLAAMDTDGYFAIVDRKKDRILGAGGFNIYPREIEDVLFEHPKVREAAVVGLPHPEKGEVVKAFVVLKSGVAATEDEILEHCRGGLAPYKVPRSVEFRTELPRTLVGKVLRRALRQPEIP
jgi:long-chain acyl-CoA synthetase